MSQRCVPEFVTPDGRRPGMAHACTRLVASAVLTAGFALAAWTARADTPATSPPPVAATPPASPAPAKTPAAAPAPAPAFDHSAWDRLLWTYVDDQGWVAYRDLQAKDAAALQSYLATLATANPQAWPRAEQIAFWVNAYNAGMWSAVLEGQSAESVTGRAQLFKSWRFEVAGESRAPDEIENGILRQKFGDPRVHFALVCAAASCPRLRREAYRGDKLDAQLDDQVKTFVNDPSRNIIDPEKPKLQLSMIFLWYRDDFAKAAGSPEDFIARYVTDDKAREWLRTGKPEARHFNYDWTLNAQPNQRPWVKWSGGASH